MVNRFVMVWKRIKRLVAEETETRKPIEEFMELLKTKGIEALMIQPRKNLKEIQVNCANPQDTRRELVLNIGPELGIQFRNIRKTKETGYSLAIVQNNTEETYIVRIRKGGKYRPGQANEIGFRQFKETR
jgi:hypothetical protein